MRSVREKNRTERQKKEEREFKLQKERECTVRKQNEREHTCLTKRRKKIWHKDTFEAHLSALLKGKALSVFPRPSPKTALDFCGLKNDRGWLSKEISFFKTRWK